MNDLCESQGPLGIWSEGWGRQKGDRNTGGRGWGQEIDSLDPYFQGIRPPLRQDLALLSLPSCWGWIRGEGAGWWQRWGRVAVHTRPEEGICGHPDSVTRGCVSWTLHPRQASVPSYVR